MKKITVSLWLLSLVIISACNKNEQLTNNQPAKEVYLDLSDTAGKYFERTSYPRQLDKKAILGRVLFYDNHLSLNNAVSCGSCHKQEFAFADNATFSRGFEGRMTGRNSPGIQNLLGGQSVPTNNNINSFNIGAMFWDGRQTNLKSMVMMPVNNHVEMGIADLETLPAKLNELAYYPGLVQEAFGTDALSVDIIAESIAYFLFSIKADSSRFDLFQAKKAELTAEELHGERLFTTKYNCRACHTPTTKYYGFENTGSNIGLDAVAKDRGMGVVTPGMDGMFRVPNLHNVALTAPYMHDGRFNTLDEVLEHYSKNIQAHPNLDDRLKDNDGKPMRMNISQEEKNALIAFMNTMTDYTMITDPRHSNPFKTK